MDHPPVFSADYDQVVVVWRVPEAEISPLVTHGEGNVEQAEILLGVGI